MQVFSNRHSNIAIAVLFHLCRNSFLVRLKHSHIIGFGSLFFLHKRLLIIPRLVKTISLPYCRNVVRNHLLGLRWNIILLLSFILELGLQLKDLGPLGFNLSFKFLVLVLVLLFLCDELLSHYFKLFLQLVESFV